MTDTSWSVRVRTAGPQQLAVHGARGSFTVGSQLDFQPVDGPPSALEAFLGAFGADLAAGFRAAAARRRLAIEDLELAASCQLDNPLTHLGVVGEVGHPGLASITATLYVTADAAADQVESAWSEALARSPLVATLQPTVALSLRLVML